MAVKKYSARYLHFLIGRGLTRASPALRAAMPFYERVVPMVDVGTAEHWRETQTLELDAAEAAFAAQLPDRPPAEIARDVALIALDNVAMLGPTGAVVDEARECVLAIRGARSFPTYHDFRTVPSRPLAKPPANYVNMVGSYRGHKHFFHFLFERLPRLYYLLNHFALGREPLVILTNDDLPDFQREIYRVLASRYPNIRYEAIPQHQRWRFARLYHVDDYQPIKRTLASREVTAFLRSLVLEGLGVNQAPATRRIYVTRSDTKKRRVTNEAELIPILEKRGFEIVAPGLLSLREQAALFASASHVVGPHGAGLTNILFSAPRTRVLEIFPSNKVKNTYFLQAKSLGQSYRAFVGGKGNAREWFSVDVAAFANALDDLLK
jgi:hypothetical protein